MVNKWNIWNKTRRKSYIPKIYYVSFLNRMSLGDWGYNSGVKYLPSMYKAMGSVPRTEGKLYRTIIFAEQSQ